jgi:hypothetical protein
MSEQDPFRRLRDPQPTKMQLKGPNVISTFDTPPSPDAVRAHEAAIRKHLQDRRPGEDPPAGAGAS